MSDLNDGVTEITLGDKTLDLKQSIKAALKVNRHFGSIGDALQAVVAQNIDAMAFVIVAGTGASSITDDMLDRVWKASPRLVGPLTEFLLVMKNGGQPLPSGDQDDAGNAER